jgi:hypothetical protein
MSFLARPEESLLHAALDADAPLITVHGLGGAGASTLVARALLGRGPALRVDLSAPQARTPREAPPGTRVFFDQVHDARAARAVAAFVARTGASVVVAGRWPIGLSVEQRVPLGPLPPDAIRALIDASLRRLGRREDTAALDLLVQAADGWPAAALSLVRMTRVLGARAAVERFAEVLDADDDARCADILRGVWQGLPAAGRAAWGTLACAHAPLDAATLAGPLAKGLPALLDAGVLDARDGHLRVPAPAAGFARRTAPEAALRAARKTHAAAVLTEAEAARARHRTDPVAAGATLERLRGDLLALACDDDAATAVRAALALEPLLTGRLERAGVVGLFERARRLAAFVSVAAEAEATLALARTWITRGDHESAERLLSAADVLDTHPRTRAYRRVYRAHLQAWRGDPAGAEALLDVVEPGLDEDLVEDTRLQRIFVALQRGDLDAADTLARLAAEHAARRPSPRMLAAARRFIAETMLLRGDAAGAVPLLAESRDAIARCGDHAGAIFFTSRLVEALRLAGRTDDAAAEARRAAEQAARTGESTLELTVLEALGEGAESWGRVAELAWRAQMPVLRAAAQRRLAACAPPAAPETLRLTPATQRAALTDTSVSLARRPTLWRLLAALAEAHARGLALPQDALFAAGWPDERAEPDSRKKRVQTAVWTLRRLLLGDHLHTRPEGYALSADLRVSIDPD